MRVPTPLIIVVMVLAFPVLIPYAFICHSVYEHRRRAAAKRRACPSCGRILGIEALYEADEYWRDYVAELHRANPGVKLRLVRFVHAICVVCCARLAFHEQSRDFTILKGEAPA